MGAFPLADRASFGRSCKSLSDIIIACAQFHAQSAGSFFVQALRIIRRRSGFRVARSCGLDRARGVVVTIHDHIANLRALLADLEASAAALPLPDDAPITLALARDGLADDAWIARESLDAIEAAAELPSLTATTPALESWRCAVLERPASFSRRDQAAAWELTALACERSGNLHGAERARREAGYTLGVRGVA